MYRGARGSCGTLDRGTDRAACRIQQPCVGLELPAAMWRSSGAATTGADNDAAAQKRMGAEMIEPKLKFSRDEYAERLAKTRKAMEVKGVELLIISDPSNMAWLTGYDGWSF